jgi:hypothetical protein
MAIAHGILKEKKNINGEKQTKQNEMKKKKIKKIEKFNQYTI